MGLRVAIVAVHVRPVGHLGGEGRRDAAQVVERARLGRERETLLIGFVLPGAVLLHMALTEGDAQFGARFVRLAGNSVLLAGLMWWAFARTRWGLLVRMAGDSANAARALGYSVAGIRIAPPARLCRYSFSYDRDFLVVARMTPSVLGHFS